MAEYKIVDATQLDTDLASVADAIRTKGGTSESLEFPQGFVDAVGAIESGGGGSAYWEDIIQESIDNSGKSDATLITAFRNTSIKDVSMFDFSKAVNMEHTFSYTSITDLEIDLTNTTSVYAMCRASKKLKNVIIKNMNSKCKSLGQMFYGCISLERVETLDVSGCLTSDGYSSPFQGCHLLKTILFVKNCIMRSFYFGDSPFLSAESVQSIFDGLTIVTTAQTITFHQDVKMLQSQVDSANAKGWTVAGGTVVSEEEYYG